MKYPSTIQDRFPQMMAKLQRDVKRLQTRTSGIDSGFPLAVLPAVVDAAYSGSGNPSVYINGAATLSGPFGYLASYTPDAGDAVLVAPVGVNKTYVILGKVA